MQFPSLIVHQKKQSRSPIQGLETCNYTMSYQPFQGPKTRTQLMNASGAYVKDTSLSLLDSCEESSVLFNNFIKQIWSFAASVFLMGLLYRWKKHKYWGRWRLGSANIQRADRNVDSVYFTSGFLQGCLCLITAYHLYRNLDCDIVSDNKFGEDR